MLRYNITTVLAGLGYCCGIGTNPAWVVTYPASRSILGAMASYQETLDNGPNAAIVCIRSSWGRDIKGNHVMKTYHVRLVRSHSRMSHKYLLDGECSEAAFNECCREADRAHAALYPDRPGDINIRGIIHAALMREAGEADRDGSHGGDIVLNGLGVRLRYSRQLDRDRLMALPD